MMFKSTGFRRRMPALIAAGLIALTAACDEVPTTPDVPDRLRVALVTSHSDENGGMWYIYEIDQEGTVDVIVSSDAPLLDAQYTSFLGTRGSIAFQRADGELIIHHLETGSESTVPGDFQRPRFSPDGTLIAYSAPVSDDDGVETAQVSVFNRSSNQVVAITRNECADDGSIVYPCALDARYPVFGEDNELYVARTILTEQGEERLSLSLIPTNLIEQSYFVLTGGLREVIPNSFFEGTLVAEYVDNSATPDEARGFYALRARTGQYLENEVPLRYASFCHDATIVGWNGTELQFVDVPGEDVARLSVPPQYGTDILHVMCSVQSRDLVR